MLRPLIVLLALVRVVFLHKDPAIRRDGNANGSHDVRVLRKESDLCDIRMMRNWRRSRPLSALTGDGKADCRHQ